jgi:hypothetical protein
MSETPKPAHHDMGGEPGGPVDRSQHAHAFWEKRVDALMSLLSSPKHRLLRVDELRRGIESLPPDAYDSMSYYERWISSITAVMLEKGVVTRAELDARIAALRERGAGR